MSRFDFFVAPDGDDQNDGSRKQPFRTIARAQQALRQTAGGARVVLREGDYVLAEGLVFEAADGGSESDPVVIKAADGERVRLLGGVVLDHPCPVDDEEALERLDTAVRESVCCWDLRAAGLNDYGHLQSRGFSRPVVPSHMELFYDGARMTLARWPNNRDDRIVKPAALAAEGDGHGRDLGKLETGFHYDGNRPRRWRYLDDVWVHGYWQWDWAASYEQIDSIDYEERLIQTRPPYGLYGFAPSQRFFYLNILEELDAPGEYYLDRRGGVLYFLPPEHDGETEPEAAVSILEEPIIAVHDAAHIEFRGLTLEYGRGDGIEIDGGEGILVSNCTIRNVGNRGVVVDGGERHWVYSCSIYNTGDGGITMSGGDRKTLTPGRHEAVKNHIHHFAQWSRCYQPAIHAAGVGLRLANNHIHDAPHCAILIAGNEHLVERNHIHDVCLDTGDVGAFYIGRDYSMRGNVVRHNLFHDLGGIDEDSSAIYIDDCASGMLIQGNVIYRCFRGMLLGGGVDNVVDNNVLVACKVGIHIDGRGMVEGEIWRNMVYQTMKDRLEAMNYLEPPYSERYPELAKLKAYLDKPDGVPPFGTKVTRNIAADCETWLDIRWGAEESMLETVADNFADRDPDFVDPEHDDFSLLCQNSVGFDARR